MTRESDKAELRRKLAERDDPWAESAPQPPDREAEFARALSGLVPTDYARELLAERHRLAVDDAVTAVLDSLAAELETAAQAIIDGKHDQFLDLVAGTAFRTAAYSARAHIPVPFG